MEFDTSMLKALSPLDGRYVERLGLFREWLSEWALLRERVRVEAEWLIALGDHPAVRDLRAPSDAERAFLRGLASGFDEAAARRIKAIERETNHDVKAVEYFLKERLTGTSLEDVREFVHFACTSEDISNLAYALMLRSAIREGYLPLARALVAEVSKLAQEHRAQPMLALTHGQPATPTTLGKELAVFVYRLNRQLRALERAPFLGKLNGATGTYSAHRAAYPDAPWPEIARRFVEGLGLEWNPLTTQIEPHDYQAELFHTLIRINAILADFDADMWAYVSRGYLVQRRRGAEVGSSTMPHKVNPIDFENAEANTGLSSAVLGHLARKLPVSRLQRDLSDSSAQRNIGVGIAHAALALESTLRGVKRVEVDRAALSRDLAGRWEVLAEAVQTVMRRAGLPQPYERLKALTQGEPITRETLHAFIAGLELPEAERRALLALTPETYTGLAAELVDFQEEPPRR